MRGLIHWDYLLQGPRPTPTIVITDHANLQYYRHPHKIGPHMAGYILTMEEYPIKLMYKPGKTNHADTLSRRPDFAPDPYNDEPTIALPEDLFVKLNMPVLDIGTYAHTAARHPTRNRGITMDDGLAICVYEIGNDIHSSSIDGDIMAEQYKHTHTLQQWKTTHGIEHRPGDLWWKNHALVVVGNDNLWRGVTALFHNAITAGHPGITKTLVAVAQYYWWPGMKDFIMQYIKGCATCQMNKVNTHPTKPPLYPITTNPEALPFQVIALDFVTKLPVSEGFDSILTVMDHDCSKAAILIPCNESITAEGMAELYARHIVPHYGIPTRVISDRDPCFRAAFTKGLCKVFNISQNISSANHPQTDGQSEQTNQGMEQYLQTVTNKDQHD
jgi:Integrase zinc binding domain